MTTHGKPAEGMECACCYDEIEGENYVEYCTGEGKDWLPSLFCEMCIATLLKRQWPIYEESLAKANCRAQQKRMLGDGPPTHIHDKKALPCPEGEAVHSLWFIRDGQTHSALLEGAPQGEARQIWWDEKLAFEFDEDEEDGDAQDGGTAPPGGVDAEAGGTVPPRGVDAEASPSTGEEKPEGSSSPPLETPTAAGGDSAQIP